MKTAEDGSYSGADIAAVGLAILGGCCRCAATIAAYNAYPSKNGYWMCGDCIGEAGEVGYATVEAADEAIFGEREPYTEYCAEHGEVEVVYIADSDVAWCPKCQKATSIDAEEAERFEHQDDEDSPTTEALKEIDRLAEAGLCQMTVSGKHAFLEDIRRKVAELGIQGGLTAVQR
jgi:hypothetical protein